ncbi:unnamed protein product [Pieris brassicae]|uniref:Kinetochore protein Spc24 n=1 Tax=Pieris brassicae TaxID=7116 RepID=A0A9P0TMN8_PIEBR|nr:unnamed protein product [Pieris brassicae]
MSQNLKWLDNIKMEFEAVSQELDEAIDRDKLKRELSKKQTALESQIVQESKLNEDLKNQLADLTRRSDDVDKVCNLLKTRLNIADSDKNKLESAREQFLLAKELTGIRLDFEYCAKHPNKAKGYIKNQHKHLLESFDMDINSDALWDLVANIFVTGDENWPPNNK